MFNATQIFIPIPVSCLGVQGEDRFYFGLVSGKFKQRYGNHLKSFRHERYKNETTLSAYVWQQKEKGRVPVIKWSVVKRAPAYNPASKKCRLCLILKHAGDKRCLNARTELFSKCRHRASFLLQAVGVTWGDCQQLSSYLFFVCSSCCVVTFIINCKIYQLRNFNFLNNNPLIGRSTLTILYHPWRRVLAPRNPGLGIKF